MCVFVFGVCSVCVRRVCVLESVATTIHTLTVCLVPPRRVQVATGGVDKSVLVFDREAGKLSSTLKGHTKRVSGVSFIPGSENLLSCAHDKTVKLWKKSGDSYSQAASFSPHAAEVTDITVHPTGQYVVSTSLDKTWSFSDIDSGRVFTTSAASDVGGTLECAAFHPDGVIFGTGTGANLVRIWDTKTCKMAATFEGHAGVVNSVVFSENGYHMASASDDKTVRVWDLRKLAVLKSFDVGAAAHSVSFDPSGKYLAAGAGDVKVYNVKGGVELASFDGHSKSVTGVRFGPAAKYIASASLDRCLKFYA